MIKKHTKLLCLLLTFLSLLNLMPVCITADDGVKVVLNGSELSFDVPPQLITSRTMVPMRKIFESLGAEVYWDDETQTVTAYRDTTVVVMQIDNVDITVNNAVITLDVPPRLIGGRTLVPVRAVAESLDAEVAWDDETQTVVITNGELPKEEGAAPAPVINNDLVSSDAPFGYKKYTDPKFGWSMNVRYEWEISNYRDNAVIFYDSEAQSYIWVGAYQHDAQLSTEQAVKKELDNMELMYTFKGKDSKTTTNNGHGLLFNEKYMTYSSTFSSREEDSSFYGRVVMFYHGKAKYKFVSYTPDEDENFDDMLNSFSAKHIEENLPDIYKEGNELALKNNEYGYSINVPLLWKENTSNVDSYYFADRYGKYRMTVNCLSLTDFEENPDKINAMGLYADNFKNIADSQNPLKSVMLGVFNSVGGMYLPTNEKWGTNKWGIVYLISANYEIPKENKELIPSHKIYVIEVAENRMPGYDSKNRRYVDDANFQQSKVNFSDVKRAFFYYVIESGDKFYIVHTKNNRKLTLEENKKLYDGIISTMKFE